MAPPSSSAAVVLSPGRGHGHRRRRQRRSGWPVGPSRRRSRLDLHRQRQAAGARRDHQLLRPRLRPAAPARPRSAVHRGLQQRPVRRRRTPRSATSAPRSSRTTGPACCSASTAPARWCARRCCATAPGSSWTGPTRSGWTPVTVSESAADGLVLRGDKATKLVGIKAERNGANGVLVAGESTARPITGIATTGNGGFGVRGRQAGQAAHQRHRHQRRRRRRRADRAARTTRPSPTSPPPTSRSGCWSTPAAPRRRWTSCGSPTASAASWSTSR